MLLVKSGDEGLLYMAERWSSWLPSLMCIVVFSTEKVVDINMVMDVNWNKFSSESEFARKMMSFGVVQKDI